jgi:hypothetical protein
VRQLCCRFSEAARATKVSSAKRLKDFHRTENPPSF